MRNNSGMYAAAILFSLVLGAPLLSGCAALLAGAAIGYEVSPDSVKAEFNSSYDRAYNVSLDVAKAMIGSIDMQDKEAGWIKSESEGNNVAIHIVKVTEETTEITVSARKYATPRVQFARNILAKIASKLK
jgi:hypothetical protein